MKDILFVSLLFLLIAGSGFICEIYFDKPEKYDFKSTISSIPADIYMKRESFSVLPLEKKSRLMNNLIHALTSDESYLRSFAYSDLCELTGQQFGNMEQMQQWPGGPQRIQSQYQKWWNSLLKSTDR